MTGPGEPPWAKRENVSRQCKTAERPAAKRGGRSAVSFVKASFQTRIPGGIPTRRTKAEGWRARIQTGALSTGGAGSGSHRLCGAGSRRPPPEGAAAPRTRRARGGTAAMSAGPAGCPPALPYSGHRPETAPPCKKRSGPAGSGIRKRWEATYRATL